jgi:hypothetical protein
MTGSDMLRYLVLAIAISAAPPLSSAAARSARAPVAIDEKCHPEGHFAFLETGTRLYRQGASVALRPMVDVSPAGTLELPSDCVTGWSVTGPGRLSRDRTALSIAADAPVGSTIVVTFVYRNSPVVARLEVIGREAVVLTGTWSQKSVEGCIGAETVGELEFAPDNVFSVTFVPFETYRDYWGHYSYDADSGAIRLNVEGGNLVPDGLDLEGAAELAGGRLRLSGVSLGGRGAGVSGSCTYIF